MLLYFDISYLIFVLSSSCQDLLEITGLDSVEYQNSWSLQNNALLLHQIRLYILEHQSEFSFPWTGMKFIITKEVHHSWAIDYSERCLRVDCCDISAHWMNSLYLVNSQQINAMNRAYAATIKRKKDLGRFIQAHVQKQTKLKFATKDYCVVVEKGFTCSEYLFARFLLQFDVTLFGQESMLLPGVEPFENSNEVETIPKTIHVIIEEGHGTKVLESGDFRVDGTCSIDDCLQLVVNNLERSLSKKTIHVETLNHIGKLSKRVVSLLGLKSIKHGVGVDNQKYLAFLQQVEMYLILKNSQYHVTSIDDIPEVTNLRKGIFRSLQGLDVVVGHYCSIRDDGVCILQWEFDARAIMH